MERNCATYFYDTGKKCEILREKIPANCFAWADEMEARKREKAIKEYNDPIVPAAMTDEQREKKRKATERNLKMRGGKSSFEVLDEHFLELHNQELSVTKIAEMLHVDRNRIYDYMKKNEIPIWNKKNRPTAMEAAM